MFKFPHSVFHWIPVLFDLRDTSLSFKFETFSIYRWLPDLDSNRGRMALSDSEGCLKLAAFEKTSQGSYVIRYRNLLLVFQRSFFGRENKAFRNFISLTPTPNFHILFSTQLCFIIYQNRNNFLWIHLLNSSGKIGNNIIQLFALFICLFSIKMIYLCIKAENIWTWTLYSKFSIRIHCC